MPRWRPGRPRASRHQAAAASAPAARSRRRGDERRTPRPPIQRSPASASRYPDATEIAPTTDTAPLAEVLDRQRRDRAADQAADVRADRDVEVREQERQREVEEDHRSEARP